MKRRLATIFAFAAAAALVWTVASSPAQARYVPRRPAVTARFVIGSPGIYSRLGHSRLYLHRVLPRSYAYRHYGPALRMYRYRHLRPYHRHYYGVYPRYELHYRYGLHHRYGGYPGYRPYPYYGAYPRYRFDDDDD